MNPTSEQPHLNLPAPVGETVAPEFGPPAGASASLPEMAPAQPEQALNPTAGAPIVAQPAGPLPAITLPPSLQQTPPAGDVSTTTRINVTSVADDSSVNEKIWVAKAKEIVERTKEDPTQQSKELGVFKADYLQKRYNKVIKVNE
ncbi:MAG TPA: hypothetical protein VG992_00505 [Candidatus Saccharimonadales bacterium]|nr:hypothetical protein [Candidatus Saccharimonadales bacterium]